ncbi:MAG: hypothetical protein IT299_03465 [Dehalococcoidia bacterium]|nr:hypothetical protein [Dehalococcoidia bacterium]
MRESFPLVIPDQLIGWQPGPEPVVSALIDWRVDNTVRQARTLVPHRLREAFRDLDERSAERTSLEGDLRAIEAFLDSDADPAQSAFAVFSCSGRGLWFVTPLGVPVESMVHVGDYPQFLPLIESTQDAARTLVVVANSNSARLIRLLPEGVAAEAGPHRDVATVQHSTEGGWGALGYQRHLDTEVERFAREVAAAIEHEADTLGLAHVVLSGDTVIVPPLLEALPGRLRARVDAIEHFEPWDSTREIAGTVWPRVAEIVRDRRDAEVGEIIGRAAAGGEALNLASEVEAAAANGRVDTLALDPAVVQPEAAEELIRQSLTHRSRVLIARGHAALAEAGGVAASLR